MTKYDIKQWGDAPHIIGSIDWSPEDWDYQTSDVDLARLLDEVKAENEVWGGPASDDDDDADPDPDTIICYVRERVESSDSKFIWYLSDHLSMAFSSLSRPTVSITKREKQRKKAIS